MILPPDGASGPEVVGLSLSPLAVSVMALAPALALMRARFAQVDAQGAALADQARLHAPGAVAPTTADPQGGPGDLGRLLDEARTQHAAAQVAAAALFSRLGLVDAKLATADPALAVELASAKAIVAARAQDPTPVPAEPPVDPTAVPAAVLAAATAGARQRLVEAQAGYADLARRMPIDPAALERATAQAEAANAAPPLAAMPGSVMGRLQAEANDLQAIIAGLMAKLPRSG